MSPHYDRRSDFSGTAIAQREASDRRGDAALDDAAEAIRAAEVEAAQPSGSPDDASRLEQMSIDELRKLAAELDVPDRAQITEQDELIMAIRLRL
jgi:hypothetical protein